MPASRDRSSGCTRTILATTTVATAVAGSSSVLTPSPARLKATMTLSAPAVTSQETQSRHTSSATRSIGGGEAPGPTLGSSCRRSPSTSIPFEPPSAAPPAGASATAPTSKPCRRGRCTSPRCSNRRLCNLVVLAIPRIKGGRGGSDSEDPARYRGCVASCNWLWGGRRWRRGRRNNGLRRRGRSRRPRRSTGLRRDIDPRAVPDLRGPDPAQGRNLGRRAVAGHLLGYERRRQDLDVPPPRGREVPRRRAVQRRGGLLQLRPLVQLPGRIPERQRLLLLAIRLRRRLLQARRGLARSVRQPVQELRGSRREDGSAQP